MKVIAFASFLYSASALSATTVVPFRELSGFGTGTLIQMQVDGLPAMIAPSFYASDLQIPAREAFSLSALDGDPFVQPNQGSRVFTFQYAAADGFNFNLVYGTEFAVVGLEKGDAPAGSTIYVGTGALRRENASCVAQVDAGGVAHCAIVTPFPSVPTPNFSASYWILVAAPPGPAAEQYQLTLSHVALSASGSPPFLVTGPGHIVSGVTQPLRLAQMGPIYRSNTSFPFTPASEGERYYGLVGIYSPDQFALLPFAYTVKQSFDDNAVSIPLPPINGFDPTSPVTSTNSRRGESTAQIVVQPGGTLRHLFFDIPPNTSPSTPYYGPLVLSVIVATAIPYAPSNSSVRVVRADFPGQTQSPVIAGAPADGGETLLSPYFEFDYIQSGRLWL